MKTRSANLQEAAARAESLAQRAEARGRDDVSLKATELGAKLHAKATKALVSEKADPESIIAENGALNRSTQAAADKGTDSSTLLNLQHSGASWMDRKTPLDTSLLGGQQSAERHVPADVDALWR
jgi:hypothetical protein